MRSTALALLVLVAGCRAEAPAPDAPAGALLENGVVVHEPWARPVSGADTVRVHSAVYFTLENRGPGAVEVVGARSNVAQRTEIHETTLEDGIMRMRARESVHVPAGESVRFEPAGLHVMLLQVRRDLVAGDSLTLVLEFADGEEQDVPVVVRPPAG